MSFGGTSSHTLQDALQDATNELQEALTGESRTTKAVTAPPAQEDILDPAMAAFMASQQPPSLELDKWARVIKARQQAHCDDDADMNEQLHGEHDDTVKELMQIFREERAQQAGDPESRQGRNNF